MSSLRTLQQKAKAYQAPDFVTEDLVYLTIGGSRAYGVVSPDSDIDMYGICIPPLPKVIPLYDRFLPGFGRPALPWYHWGYHGEGVDITVYSIVKFFNMAMQGNPNIIELLFTEDHHIMSITGTGVDIRGSREMFLTDNVIPKFTGFYQSQRGKLFNQEGHTAKAVLIEKYGYDTKAAYHSMRLLLEVEQLLETGTMNLEKYSDLLTGIRFGGFSGIDIETILDLKADQVQSIKDKSVLRPEPNEEYIQQVLIEMLENHWDLTLDMF